MTNETSRPARRGGCLGSVLVFLFGAVVALLIAAIILPAYLVTHRTILPGEMEMGAMAISLSSQMRANNSIGQVSTNPADLGQGRLLYLQRCQGCHGQNGDGTGPQGQSLFPPPRSLRDGHATTLSDGQIASIIENGLSYTAMPSYKANTSPDQMKLIIGYIRSMQNGTSGAVPVITPTGGGPGGGPGGAPGGGGQGGGAAATPTPAR